MSTRSWWWSRKIVVLLFLFGLLLFPRSKVGGVGYRPNHPYRLQVRFAIARVSVTLCSFETVATGSVHVIYMCGGHDFFYCVLVLEKYTQCSTLAVEDTCSSACAWYPEWGYEFGAGAFRKMCIVHRRTCMLVPFSAATLPVAGLSE